MSAAPYSYTVSFDSQGATIPASPATKTVATPATTIDALPSAPTKTGYSFDGWFTGTSGTGTLFTSTTPVTGNITVYAKWTPIAITAFSFATPSSAGIITNATHTIAVTVPYGTDASGLVPSITHNGTSITPATDVAQNFTVPVIYTVTAADGAEQTYTVTVTVALNTTKAITAFNFASLLVSGVITESTHTIVLTVPYGTNLMSLTPTINHSGASISPATGVAQSFTTPVIYTVTASNGTIQAYTVMVLYKLYAIGETGPSGVGKVFYITDGGGHGLEAAPSRLERWCTTDPSSAWIIGGATQTTLNGNTLTAIGTGLANSNAIIAQTGHSASAAKLCREYRGGGLEDWFLASKDEFGSVVFAKDFFRWYRNRLFLEFI